MVSAMVGLAKGEGLGVRFGEHMPTDRYRPKSMPADRDAKKNREHQGASQLRQLPLCNSRSARVSRDSRVRLRSPQVGTRSPSQRAPSLGAFLIREGITNVEDRVYARVDAFIVRFNL